MLHRIEWGVHVGMSGLEKGGFSIQEYLWHINVADEGNDVWMPPSHEARHFRNGSLYSHHVKYL